MATKKKAAGKKNPATKPATKKKAAGKKKHSQADEHPGTIHSHDRETIPCAADESPVE